jgi:spermidine/putrescine transport system permease protein
MAVDTDARGLESELEDAGHARRARSRGLAERFAGWAKQPGPLLGGPLMLFLAFGFLGPLLLVGAFSLIPPNTFTLGGAWTLANYVDIVAESYWISFAWSFGLAAVTTVLLVLICYPLAYAMTKVFGRAANLLTLLLVIPLFVSENIRLFGWVLSLVKGGVLPGTAELWFGLDVSGLLYTVPAIVLGLVYVYLPFMLFPMVLGLSMVPDRLREAAIDLGATRWQLFREVELPLATPGILIGCLLTFILALGSLAESKILGGSAIVMIADDIESAFTFAQNWPKGAALSVLLIVLAGGLIYAVLSRLDLDKILGRG